MYVVYINNILHDMSEYLKNLNEEKNCDYFMISFLISSQEYVISLKLLQQDNSDKM